MGDYEFISVDITQIGNASNSGIWEGSQIGKAWKQEVVNIPPPTPLLCSNDPVHYVTIGDEVLPLQPNLLRPFSGRNLNTMTKKMNNYRLLGAIRVV